MISAIVIAAGESKRMGRTKQLLPWKGKVLLQHVLDSILGSKVDEVILVLGCEAERILERVNTREDQSGHQPGLSARNDHLHPAWVDGSGKGG